MGLLPAGRPKQLRNSLVPPTATEQDCATLQPALSVPAQWCRERRVFVLDTATGKIVTNTLLMEPKVGTRLSLALC